LNYFIGLDFGTSGARVALIDAQKTLLFQTGQRFEAGEHDRPVAWQELLFSLLAEIPEEYRQTATAIEIDGTSSTVLLCDVVGQPIAAPLLYHDGRGVDQLSTLQLLLAKYPDTPTKDIVLSSTSSLAKLLWLCQHTDAAKAHYLLHQADWLGFLLHGQLGISDYHNSLKLGYDVQHLTYPDWFQPIHELLQQRGANHLKLPQVKIPGQAIASVLPMVAISLDLPKQCKVCAGTTDSNAAFFASGASQPGEAVTSLGSTLVLKLLSETPVNSRAHGIYSHRWGDLWLVGGASNTGGAVLQHFFSPEELTTLSQKIPVGEPSPLDYYPLLQPGERFPMNDPQLAPRLEPRPEDPVAFLHGLLESIGRIEREGYRLLEQLGASPLKRVYTAGGGAANLQWQQIRDRLLGVPVQPATQTEAAYGAACLALNGWLQSCTQDPCS